MAAAAGQLLDLLREESPLRFRQSEVGGAFERSSGGLSLPEPTQHRAAGCVEQVVGVEAGCDRLDQSERRVRPIDFGQGDSPIEREQMSQQDVGLDSLGVEDAGGQAEQSVNVGLFEKFASHCLAGAAFEEDVVGNDNRSAAVFALGS